ncbi:hypothetical protein MMC06_001827 [Schaereria dolodes]|nr:hypothetical protein [Schaereria dolodes]
MPPPPPAAASPFSSPSTAPPGWSSHHDVFVRSLASKGEDAETIVILLEAEYPDLVGKVSEGWVGERVGAK